MAFSGGGIRAAAQAYGVLQRIAAPYPELHSTRTFELVPLMHTLIHTPPAPLLATRAIQGYLCVPAIYA